MHLGCRREADNASAGDLLDCTRGCATSPSGAKVAVWDEAADGLCWKGALAVDQIRSVAAVRKLWFQGAVQPAGEDGRACRSSKREGAIWMPSTWLAPGPRPLRGRCGVAYRALYSCASCRGLKVQTLGFCSSLRSPNDNERL